MRVLVTGASGFVGRALCAHLREHGLSVRGALRRPDPAAADAVAVGDIGPDTDWRAALDGVDAVAHLAARVHRLRDTAGDPLAQYREVNVEGTRRLAQAARDAGVRRLVLLSSIKVNGEGRVQPYRPADPPQPQDAYAVSKLEAEQALAEVAAGTALEWVVLRPPLVYGPGVGANFLGLLRAVARGWPLPLRAIDNRRSLIYVGNLVDALRVCLLAPAAANRLFLVRDGEDVSTPELVRRVAQSLGVTPRLVAVPCGLLRAGAWLGGRRAAFDRLAGSLCVDDSALRALLAWQPPFDMREGLAHTARWWREQGAGSGPRR
jgi:nucleoside-diphosphate-sugar epimerase